MAIEIFLIAVGVVLFGGLFVGLFLSYTEAETERASSGKPAERQPALYGWEARNAALAEELMLRQIEHHLRREAMLAEQFVMDPNPHTLRAGEHVRLGAN
jgi:hypothetical protein